MTKELENLAKLGQLHVEEPREDELKGLRRSAESRLEDARNDSLSYAGRFDLAYNAAHALALYALRRTGYRSQNRYVIFQALPHTAGLEARYWRVLAKAHEIRNRSEYEGYLREDPQLLQDLLSATDELTARLFA